ncbi:MAG TPA: hypothetical protein VLM05_05170, partial [Mycobacteriales bacterium]|nr:hypothetical protein [Mycobacteriales bacterium]
MRPLAIAVVMAGVVLLAFGTWLILRASFARTPVRKPAPRAEPPARREPVPFPPAAAARTGAWTAPPGEDVPVTGRVPSEEGTRTGGATRWTPSAAE